MIVNAGYRGKVGAAVPKFTYTGNYKVRDDGVVELLTSGTIVFLNPATIDVFLVGGGAGGIEPPSGGASDYSANPGGAGGYTRTIRKVSVAENTPSTVIIGAGGAVTQGYPWSGTAGGSTSFNELTVKGAERNNVTDNLFAGKTKGGSGCGGGVRRNTDYGAGGSDGANGEDGYSGSGTNPAGGKGQGFTTREFGEASGKLYAGGGGGGRGINSELPVVSAGGSGGGGSGGWCASTTMFQHAAAGVANTGGGGGGGARSAASGDSDKIARAGTGGSGIVCFRESVELPELAGTWVLNEMLYAPENEFTQSVSFTAKSTTGSKFNFTSINCNGEYLRFATTSYTIIYEFNKNKWSNKYKTLIFPAGATASNEFRAWLASNATKQ